MKLVATRLFTLLPALISLTACAASQPVEPAPPSYSFVVYGDNQNATNSRTSGKPERMAVPQAIVALKPDFILHTGDLMDHGYDAEAYDRFREYFAPMLTAAPFFPTMGNHDAGYKGIANYKRFLEATLFNHNPDVYGDEYENAFNIAYNDDPAPYPTSYRSPDIRAFRPNVPSGVSFKTFYAFRFRNAYFISFEQGTRWWTNTPKSWVRKHLELARQDAQVEHVFVYMHHPIYSSTMFENPPNPAKPGAGECVEPVRRHYEDLFREFNVTAVFSGHAHLYDRFYVPDDGSATRAKQPPMTYPHDGRGVHYIVTGGGGGPLNPGHYRADLSDKYSQRRKAAHHVMHVQVTGRRLDISMVEVSGGESDYTKTVFDRFAIEPDS